MKIGPEVALLSGHRLRLPVGTGWNYVEYESLGDRLQGVDLHAVLPVTDGAHAACACQKKMVADESTGRGAVVDAGGDLPRGARRMLASVLELEAGEYIAAVQYLMDMPAGGWWCATGTPGPAG